MNTAAIGFFTIYALWKYAEYKKDKVVKCTKQKLSERQPSTLLTEGRRGESTHVASLIEGVYKWAKKVANHASWWENEHYERIPLESLLTKNDMHSLEEALEEEESSRSFGVLKKKRDASPVAPEWVIAIRGTKTISDIKKDIQICLQDLHVTNTVKLLKCVVERVFDQLGSDHERSRGAVLVTGHSLGAALGMLVAIELTLAGESVDSYFFNPPFATVDALAEYVKHFAFQLMGFNSAGTDSEKFWDRIHRHGRKVMEAVTVLISNGHQREELLDDFVKLEGWSPYLFLHQNDPVSCKYITHFEKRLPGDISSWFSLETGVLKLLTDKVKTFHLMPRAVGCIVKTDESNPRTAHGLRQFWAGDLPIEIKQVDLLKLGENHKTEVRAFLPSPVNLLVSYYVLASRHGTGEIDAPDPTGGFDGYGLCKICKC